MNRNSTRNLLMIASTCLFLAIPSFLQSSNVRAEPHPAQQETNDHKLSNVDKQTSNSNLHTQNTNSQSTNSQSTTANTPQRESPKLFGRIQELYTTDGAKLPLEIMAPIRDTSLDEKFSISASKQSYPIEFAGTWSGELTVMASNFDKSFWEFDPIEADTQVVLLKPGTKGRCTVVFEKGRNNAVELQPCNILFTAPLAESDQKRYYALHLGDISAGWGVTGNEIKSQLKQNEIKNNADNIVEQQIVTRDTDRNPKTKKVHSGYTENVLRFTRLNDKRLYLQAASVSYSDDGKFQNKVILNGTLARTDGFPNPY